MKILTFGEIMDLGCSVFTAVVSIDNNDLYIQFKGVVRSQDPYKDLRPFISDLDQKLKESGISSVQIDFTELKYCNSTGFYALMDIIEAVYSNTKAPVHVKRLKNDDWQQVTLPILFNIENSERARITAFADEEEFAVA